MNSEFWNAAAQGEQARIDERDLGLKRLAADLSAAQAEVERLRAEVKKLTKQRFRLCAAADYHDADDGCVDAAIRGIGETHRSARRLREAIATMREIFAATWTEVPQ